MASSQHSWTCGYDGCQQESGEFTVEEAAADAIAPADELGWDRFSVIGHTKGGKIAHQVLLQAPDRVRADRPQPGPGHRRADGRRRLSPVLPR